MYALCDCNSFYASCEQIFKIALRGKPVVVLSNNDGCVVARSREAKLLSIPDFEPYFKIKQYLEQNHVHVFSSNYELYADISSRVKEVLDDFSPEQEVYSIDESFLLLDGLNADLVSYGHEIKDTVWRDVRMPVCVGFGETKTLAKLANHIAKKSNKLNGVCVLDDLDKWNKVFGKLPVSKVWGVGRQYTKRLSYLDIKTVYDLRHADQKMIRKHFGVELERTVLELNGERCMNMDSQPQNKKQIYSTQSFGNKVTFIKELEQAVSQYATKAAIKLRKQNSLVKTVLVFIETSRFENHHYRNRSIIKLPIATNDSREIIAAVKRGVREIFKPGYSYAKAGVGLIEIIDQNNMQLNFFNEYQHERSSRLMETIDQINRHEYQVFFASSGIDQRWKMQRKLKSASYTTRLEDVPIIKMG